MIFQFLDAGRLTSEVACRQAVESAAPAAPGPCRLRFSWLVGGIKFSQMPGGFLDEA